MYWVIVKMKYRQLCREESGVAFLYLVSISMVALLAGLSGMALGQVAQDRMELQGAVDNAAYAGALVQADCLSRLAALNRAMAWTYVQNNRRQTDYIMNRYAKDVVDMHSSVYNTIYNNSISNSSNSSKNRAAAQGGMAGTSKRAEVTMTAYQGGTSWTLAIGTIQNLRTGGSAGTKYENLAESIRNGSANVSAMNNAITAIKNNLQAGIEAAAKEAFDGNCPDAGVSHACICGDARDYLASYASEYEFLGRCYRTSGSGVNADGWQSLGWWTARTSSSGEVTGFSRSLQRTLKVVLQGRFWDYLMRSIGTGGYLPEEESGPHTFATRPDYDKPGSNPLNANDNASVTVGGTYAFQAGGTRWDTDSVGAGTAATWGTSQAAYPVKLNANFFGKDGSIVVAAKRPMRNPFAFLRGGNPGFDIGFYGKYGKALIDAVFPVAAVAAARAGYRVPGDEDGAYRTTWSDETKWNLFVDDWDAVMLPLCKAWQDGRDGSWDAGTHDDAYYSLQLLSEVATRLGVTESFWGIGTSVSTDGGENDVLH